MGSRPVPRRAESALSKDTLAPGDPDVLCRRSFPAGVSEPK